MPRVALGRTIDGGAFLLERRPMPHGGQHLAPVLPTLSVGGRRRGESLREETGELIQNTPQTVSLEVARECIRVKAGRIAEPCPFRPPAATQKRNAWLSRESDLTGRVLAALCLNALKDPLAFPHK